MNMSTLVTCGIEFIGGSAQYNSGPLDAVSEMPSLDRIAGFCLTYQGALFLCGVGSYGGGSSLMYRVKVGWQKKSNLRVPCRVCFRSSIRNLLTKCLNY